MATRRFLNIKTPGPGRVQVDLNFPSGAAEDGTFPDGLLDDGYVDDAYGAGEQGLMRTDPGTYCLMLNDVYHELESWHFDFDTTSAKVVIGQGIFPMHRKVTGTDGKKRSAIWFRTIDASAGEVDLAYNDRISISLVFKNTGSSP